MKFILSLSMIILFNCCAFANLPANIKAQELMTAKPTLLATKFSNAKGLVLVFLSAKCPCSNSHIKILKSLSEKYKDYKFVGVHSNADETSTEAQKYFKNSGLKFEILQDNDSHIANLFQAFKTPHVFLLNPNGEIIYQGGVTNSSNAESADQNFLDEALTDLEQNKPLRTTEGRTLGCVIMRKNELPK